MALVRIIIIIIIIIKADHSSPITAEIKNKTLYLHSHTPSRPTQVCLSVHNKCRPNHARGPLVDTTAAAAAAG